MRRNLVHISRFIFGRLFRLKFLEKKLLDNESFFYKWRGLFVPSWKSYLKPTIRNTRISGLNFVLDISDYIDWKAYYRIGTEDSKWLFKQINKNDIILDVGANLGYYALNFAKKAPEGEVICFEPDLHNFSKLEQNVRSNDFKNIQIYNFGLGSEKGKFYLGVIDEQNTGMNSIISEENRNSVNSHEVQIESLDGIPSIQVLKKIDWVKVDIEGYEYQFLQGAKDTLKKYYPILFMELCDSHLRRQSSSAKEVVEFIKAIGYQSIVNVKTQDKLTDLNRLDGCQFDILCKVK